MNASIINLEKLHPLARKRIIPFLDAIVHKHSGKIIAAFIYGSATGRNYNPKTSDINSAFIFHHLDFEMLRDCLDIVSKGLARGIAAPLFMTKKELESSLDVFPIEYLEMKGNHILVYGVDIFAGLEIEGQYIRLFCEQQIKGKIIRIRQGYLECGQNKARLKRLLQESLSSLLPIFRNLIGLRGMQPAVEKEKIINQLCVAYELQTNPFAEVHRDKAHREKIASNEIRRVAEQYIDELQRLAMRIDQLWVK